MNIKYDKKLRDKIQPLINHVCEYTGIETRQIDFKIRDQYIVLSRHLVMYYLREHTKLSLTVIASIFAHDHANCSHAIKHINDKIDTEKKFRHYIESVDTKIHQLIHEIFNPRQTFKKSLNELILDIEINAFHGCYVDFI